MPDLTLTLDDLEDRLLLDKLPLNLVETGLINVLFPDAKIIVALRDPRDVCLSCFMQGFDLNIGMVNFLWWERTVELYANVMDLWLHVREMLTLPFIEVRYEDTVRDLEGQARRMLDFLGLEWDDRVIRFYEAARKKAILTPSFAAVTKPVHTGAIGRWRNYAGPVERVAGTLQPYIKAFGYD